MVNIEGLKLELKKALQNITLEESKAWLIKSLLKLKLSTWDVYYFAKKKADLRTTIKTLDWKTMSVAMRIKLRDIKATLTTLRRNKSNIEEKIKKHLGENEISLKQIIASWRKIFRREKELRQKKYEKKIEHLKENQVKASEYIPTPKPNQTFAPKYLREFRALTIFKQSTEFPAPQPPLGPFIGSLDITLTEEEKKILSKELRPSVGGMFASFILTNLYAKFNSGF